MRLARVALNRRTFFGAIAAAAICPAVPVVEVAPHSELREQLFAQIASLLGGGDFFILPPHVQAEFIGPGAWVVLSNVDLYGADVDVIQ